MFSIGDRDEIIYLPPELGVQILSYLDPKDLRQCSQVSKAWQRIAEEKGSWNDQDAFKAHHDYISKRREIETLSAKIKALPSLDHSTLQAECDQLKLDCDKLLKNYTLLKNKKKANDTMMQLFGGKAAFEKLPVLEVTHPHQAYMNFINPDHMTAPLMRGNFITDNGKINREFFVIRAREVYENREMDVVCQTFFQRASTTAAWTDATYKQQPIIKIEGYIINHLGKIDSCNTEAYKTLKTLISTGRCTTPWVDDPTLTYECVLV